MKIYRLKPYTGEDNVYIESTGFSKELVFKNLDGIKLPKIQNYKFVIKNKTKVYPDLLGTGSSEFFVSHDLKSFLEENINKQELNFIEFLIEKKKYWFLNIVGLRDCMDYTKSTYTKHPNNDPDEITNLVVLDEKISKYDIFRLKDNSVPVFITSDLKIKMEQMNFTGIKFIEIMDLTYG